MAVSVFLMGYFFYTFTLLMSPPMKISWKLVEVNLVHTEPGWTEGLFFMYLYIFLWCITADGLTTLKNQYTANWAQQLLLFKTKQFSAMQWYKFSAKPQKCSLPCPLGVTKFFGRSRLKRLSRTLDFFFYCKILEGVFTFSAKWKKSKWWGKKLNVLSPKFFSEVERGGWKEDRDFSIFYTFLLLWGIKKHVQHKSLSLFKKRKLKVASKNAQILFEIRRKIGYFESDWLSRPSFTYQDSFEVYVVKRVPRLWKVFFLSPTLPWPLTLAHAISELKIIVISNKRPKKGATIGLKSEPKMQIQYSWGH